MEQATRLPPQAHEDTPRRSRLRAVVTPGVLLLATIAAPTSSAWSASPLDDPPQASRGAPRAESAAAATGNSGTGAGPVLLGPTQGRPVFVPPGGTLQVVAQIPDAGERPEFALVRDRPIAQRFVLTAPADARQRLSAGQPLNLTVPPDAAEQTYDLEIRVGTTRLLGRHCVAVQRPGQRLRLVHLSNMNVGDPGAPEFDARLVDEINLVSPTLIVATGDYLDATYGDLAAGWEKACDFFARFDAPALLACGDHDDIDQYSRRISPSPIGTIEIGRCRGVVLYDLPSRPIDADPEQLRWVERTLARPPQDGLVFIVSHDESPNLLRSWRESGQLAAMIASARLGLWLSGGHRDADSRTYADLAGAVRPMLLVRTQQSSPAPRDGADGVSHYRIVDVVGDRVFMPTDRPAAGSVPPSTPVGRLRVTFDGPNDGSRAALAFTAVNNLPYRLDELSVRVLLRRIDEGLPWCQGAKLMRVLELGRVWECTVTFDLPDRGAVHAVLGTGTPPVPPSLAARFDIPQTLALHTVTTPDGVSFAAVAEGVTPAIVIENKGTALAEVMPQIRLDGSPLAYRVENDARPAALTCRLRLAPAASAVLRPDMSAVRVSPGRREVQVYVNSGSAWWPICYPVDVTVAP